MKFHKIILYIFTLAVVLFPNNSNAAGITPYIGDSDSLHLSFTTDIDASGLSSYHDYLLAVFKYSGSAPARSWRDIFCTTGSNYFPVASVNIGWNVSTLNLTNTSGPISELSRSAEGIKFRVTSSFTETHPEKEVYLFYTLINTRESLSMKDNICAANPWAAFEPKGPLSVVEGSDGGDEGIPVIIKSPAEIDIGTAKVSGTSFRFLRNLFPGGRASGQVDQEVQTFPVLGIILTSLLYLAGLLLLIGVIYSGIILMRATSDEDAAKAKKNLTWALTGAFIVVIANWLVDTIIRFLSQ